jgi:hypothetical protein
MTTDLMIDSCASVQDSLAGADALDAFQKRGLAKGGQSWACDQSFSKATKNSKRV